MELFDALAIVATGGYLLIIPCFVLSFLLSIELSVKGEQHRLHKALIIVTIVLAIILYAPIIATYN